MHKLFNAAAASAVIVVLIAALSLAATVPVPTGPTGTNPVNNPAILSDLAATVNNINANLAPPNVGMTPVAANGHMQTGATPPVLTSCGTSPAVVGSDTAGLVTMGTGTPATCTITFATTYVVAPFCTVTWQTNIASMIYTISATAISLTQTATSSNKVNYVCVAQQGG